MYLLGILYSIYKLYGSNGDNKTPWVYLSSGKEYKEKRNNEPS